MSVNKSNASHEAFFFYHWPTNITREVTRIAAAINVETKIKIRFLLMGLTNISGRKLLVKVFIIKPDLDDIKIT
jgi:hypothetical protein